LCSESCSPQCAVFKSHGPCQTDADCASEPGSRCVADHFQYCDTASNSCTSLGGVCLQPCPLP
jgi:hypothetical protein